MDKAEIAQRLGVIQGEITEIDSKLRYDEKAYESADRQVRYSIIALLFGLALVGIGFVSDLTVLICGGILVLAGLLTLGTQSIERGQAEGELKERREKLKALKEEQARLQAELVI